jgi:hypothetical protein
MIPRLAATAIPGRMKYLPKDARGYPVPFIVMRDRNDRPIFTVNDDRKVMTCLTKDLCPICGLALLRGRWFVGGPGSAFMPTGAYIDPPTHGECARYALAVCPFLAAPNYSKRIETGQLALGDLPDDVPAILTDPTMDPRRPPSFILGMAVGQKVTGGPFNRYIIPRKPWRVLERWRHGAKVEDLDPTHNYAAEYVPGDG